MTLRGQGSLGVILEADHHMNQKRIEMEFKQPRVVGHGRLRGRGMEMPVEGSAARRHLTSGAAHVNTGGV